MQLFLTLLRIIGILILAVILLVLLVVLLVLLCPVRYRAIVTRELNKNPEVTARVTWLLHLLSVHVDYQDKLSYCVKILGITLLKDDDVLGPKEKTPEEAVQGEVENKDDSQKILSQTSTDSNTEAPQNQALKNEALKNEAPQNEDSMDKADISSELDAESDSESTAHPNLNRRSGPESDPDPAKEKIPLGERIGNLINRIAEFLADLQGKIPEKIAEVLEKIAAFLEKISEYPDTVLEKIDTLQKKKEKLLKQLRDEQNQTAVKSIFGTVGSLLTHIRPQKLKITGRLGFDDPATTGQIFGVIGMLMPLYGENIHLEAVFDEAVVEGKLEVKGRIRIGTMLYMALKLIAKKEVRRLIAQMKRLKNA